MAQAVSDIVYDFIRNYQRRYRIPPTVREIADGCHLGTTTVQYHIQVLQANGRIRHQRGKARSIVVVDESSPEN